MPKKPNQLLFYIPVGLIVYYILYLGLVGYNIIPNYLGSYHFSTYNNIKPIMSNPFSFIPDKPFAPVYIVFGGLGIVGIYLHYFWNRVGGYKK